MARKEFTQEDREKMDAAAVVAEKDLKDLPDDYVISVARWVVMHKGAAGYKRLGKILADVAERNPL